MYFIGEEQGLHFIAFEFVSGTNIRELIQQQRFISPEDTVNYALQIAIALAQEGSPAFIPGAFGPHPPPGG